MKSALQVLVFDEGSYFSVGRETVATAESRKFNDEIDVDLFGVHAFYEVVGSAHGTAGSEDVVVEDNDIVGGNGIAVDFDSIFAILFVVGSAESVGGELTGFANGDEAGADFEGEYRAADEAARLDADDLSYAFIAIELSEVPTDDMQSAWVLKRRGKVFEKDAFLREILNVADVSFNVFHDL